MDTGPAAAPGPALGQVLVVDAGGQRWAVPLAAARQVVARPALTRVPGAPSSVLGLANVRGQAVPVFDTAARLGGEALGRAPVAVVVDTAWGPVGLAVASLPVTAAAGGGEPALDVGALVEEARR